MTLSDAEFNIVLAALRLQAILYDNRAKASLAGGNRLDAMKEAAFARACADISNRMESERPNNPRKILSS